MKMATQLLLGVAAGLVALSGAHALDITATSALTAGQKDCYGSWAEGAGLGLKQKLVSSASYIGSPTRGFANADVLLFVHYKDKSTSAPI